MVIKSRLILQSFLYKSFNKCEVAFGYENYSGAQSLFVDNLTRMWGLTLIRANRANIACETVNPRSPHRVNFLSSSALVPSGRIPRTCSSFFRPFVSSSSATHMTTVCTRQSPHRASHSSASLRLAIFYNFVSSLLSIKQAKYFWPKSHF